jgi:hypothetical protein
VNVIHHQTEHETLGIHHDDALVFLDVLRDLLLKLAQGSNRFPAPETTSSPQARAASRSPCSMLRPELKLLDDLFVQPRAFASVSISNWLELLVSASHLAEMLHYRAVHLLLRTTRRKLRGLIDPALILLPQRAGSYRRTHRPAIAAAAAAAGR